MKIFVKICDRAAAISGVSASHAQAPKAKNNAASTSGAGDTGSATAESANPCAPPGWVARCSSASRGAPLECAIEQSAVLTKTGQLIVLVNIRVPAETRAPVALVQLPLGLNLPGRREIPGRRRQDVRPADPDLRERAAATPTLQISPDVLAALKSGKQLKVSFQNMAKENISIPMPLADFAAAYEKIK